MRMDLARKDFLALVAPSVQLEDGLALDLHQQARGA